jgi:hypothetical protein
MRTAADLVADDGATLNIGSSTALVTNVTALGITTSWDQSPLCTEAMSMSSRVGIDLSSAILAAWSAQIGWHDARGMMKSGDGRSGLSFISDIINLLASQVDPVSRSRCMESFTPVYNHVGRERS